MNLQHALPKIIGKKILNLWREYNDCEIKEAKFVKALDKIETLTQLAESGYKTYDKPEFIAKYANKSVRMFPELSEMLKIVKIKLKVEFNKGNIEWKEDIIL